MRLNGSVQMKKPLKLVEPLPDLQKESYNLSRVLILDRFRQLKQQYDLKIKEAELIESKLKQSTHHHQLEEVQALQQTVGMWISLFTACPSILTDKISISCITPCIMFIYYWKMHKCEKFCYYNCQFSEEQENIEKKAKTTIETATAKCKNIEEKMKVLLCRLWYLLVAKSMQILLYWGRE